MAFKDFLAKLNRKKLEKNQKFKEIEDDFMLRKRLAEKQKSPNERELEDFIHKEREDKIKHRLEKFKNREKKGILKGDMFFGQESTMLDNGPSVLHNDNSIMGKSNMFGLGGTSKKKAARKIGGTGRVIKGNSMFFE